MTIDQIKQLYYDQGLSCREVGEKVGKTVWQVIRFMRQNNLKLRTGRDTQKIQYMRKPLSFNQKVNLTSKEKLLYIAGHMIYLAEGNKISNGVVDLANCNEKMILIFLKMLRKIYQVDKKRIRILVYCYTNQNPKLLIKHWSLKLNIPINQFIKPYIRHDFNPTKTNKMPYGLVHIRYNDKRLFMKIWEEIGIILNQLLIS